MRNLKATIQYDGSHYCGFQAQEKAEIRTVQETLEQVLYHLCKEKIRVASAGRTDSGVHALGQVVNFYTKSVIPADKMLFAINQQLPQDLVMTTLAEVPLAFHARKYALGKHYQYKIYNSRKRTAFGNQYFYRYPLPLDEGLVRQGCTMLEGTHNFKGFCASGSSVKSYIRTLYYIRLTREDDWWVFDFYGDGFLYNMVRIIIGTLLEIGSGKKSLQIIADALESQDRRRAGRTAPAAGLYLKNVFYP